MRLAFLFGSVYSIVNLDQFPQDDHSIFKIVKESPFPIDSKNVFRSVAKGNLTTDIANIKSLLRDELTDMSPSVHDKIASSIESSKVDRNRYRDLFYIKKRIISNGDKRIVSLEIKEKIIPKNQNDIFYNKDTHLKIIFAMILLLLAGLVFTTTIKMYQNLIRHEYFPGMNGKQELN